MAAVVPVSTPAPSGGDCAAPAPRRWSLRQIGWRRVFARQDYTAVLLMVLFGVGILLAEKITTVSFGHHKGVWAAPCALPSQLG